MVALKLSGPDGHPESTSDSTRGYPPAFWRHGILGFNMIHGLVGTPLGNQLFFLPSIKTSTILSPVQGKIDSHVGLVQFIQEPVQELHHIGPLASAHPVGDISAIQSVQTTLGIDYESDRTWTAQLDTDFVQFQQADLGDTILPRLDLSICVSNCRRLNAIRASHLWILADERFKIRNLHFKSSFKHVNS